MFAVKKLKGLNRLFLYILAQYLGAFVASALVFVVYYQALNKYDGGNRTMDTAGIWASYPNSHINLTFGAGLVDQVISTMLLVLCIMAITDSKNHNSVPGLGPLLCGFVVLVIGNTFGLNCGFPLNPARDLSPRLYTAIAGWGSEVFSYQNYLWFLVPIIGPHVGALLGAILYLVFIGNHLPVLNRKCDTRYLNEGNDDNGQELRALNVKQYQTSSEYQNEQGIAVLTPKNTRLASASHEDFTVVKHRENLRNLRAHQSANELNTEKGLKPEQFEQLKASVDALRASIDALK